MGNQQRVLAIQKRANRIIVNPQAMQTSFFRDYGSHTSQIYIQETTTHIQHKQPSELAKANTAPQLPWLCAVQDDPQLDVS